MNDKKVKVINATIVENGKNNLGKNLEKSINNILTKTARVVNYGDELLYEDKEPGLVLDESRN